MIIDYWAVVALIVVHFVADFVLQSDTMAKNKSKSSKWLGIHILCYMGPLLLFCFSLGWIGGLLFTLVNGAAHFATDYVTSRITSRLWAKGDVHNFFVVIGLDQSFHMITLVTSYLWIGSRFS